MLWLRTWRLGVKSLLLHPMRSLLTVLGIFIGVSSVIWLLAIGEGISYEAQKQIESLGADTIIIRSIEPPDDQSTGFRAPEPYGIRRTEYELLNKTIPTIRSSLPIREIRRKFGYNGKFHDGRLVGCTPEYAEVTRLEIASGHFITDSEVDSRQNHCVLAAKMADKLFPIEDPIGRKIYLPEHRDFYTVVGVLKHREATAAIGGSLAAQEFSNDVYIPISTLRQRIGDMIITRGSGSFNVKIVELNQVTLRVDSVDNVERTAQLVKATLGQDQGREDISTVVPLELLRQAETTRFMFMLFMGLIAAVSLVVGGIGIMNIMLATVTERTREIGIRRALGAKQADIVRQFLVETISLSIVGGITGILGGMFCPWTIDMARAAMNHYAAETMARLPDVVQQVRPIIVPESIPISFGIAVMIGVVFGIYPAIRAAQMDPIEALRHE